MKPGNRSRVDTGANAVPPKAGTIRPIRPLPAGRGFSFSRDRDKMMVNQRSAWEPMVMARVSVPVLREWGARQHQS